MTILANIAVLLILMALPAAVAHGVWLRRKRERARREYERMLAELRRGIEEIRWAFGRALLPTAQEAALALRELNEAFGSLEVESDWRGAADE